MIKYTKFSIIKNKKEKFFNNIDKVFWLAIIPKSSGTLQEYRGINVGISLRHKSEKEERKFYNTLFKVTDWAKDSFIKIYLYGQDKETNASVIVPVIVGEANGYEKDMGTSCLFGYFSPEILATDSRPIKTTFGSISKELVKYSV